jgi:hypothetical protein
MSIEREHRERFLSERERDERRRKRPEGRNRSKEGVTSRGEKEKESCSKKP